MVKFALILLVTIPIVGCAVSGAASVEEYGSPTPSPVSHQTNDRWNLAEYGSPTPVPLHQYRDWENLAKTSTLVAVGQVNDIYYVVDEKILYEKTEIKDGIVPLPNTKDGVKGILVRFRLDEIIASKNDKQIGEVVDIYIKDGNWPPMHSPIPGLLMDKKYVVALSKLKKSEEFVGKTVIQPLNPTAGSSAFEYKKAFEITDKKNGYLQITDSNQDVINEVRRILKKP
jgi:hypothetical protein